MVKAWRLTKTAPVPCIVREAGCSSLAEDDSLAGNIQRAPLHPLDQYRAFQDMRIKGMSEEEVAAAFFVSVNVVKQRLRLTGRATPNVSRSLKKMESFGLVRMEKGQGLKLVPKVIHERVELALPLIEPRTSKGTRK